MKYHNINKLKIREASQRAKQQELEDKLQKLKIIMVSLYLLIVRF